jgi:hypothetical protein
MTYFSKEQKKAIAPKIVALGKKFGVKATLSVLHHSEVVLSIASGGIDFIGNARKIEEEQVESIYGSKIRDEYIDVNPYHFEKHFSDKALEYLKEAIAILNTGNYDNSDIMTDYFDKGHYVRVRVGRWDKPYKLEA